MDEETKLLKDKPADGVPRAKVRNCCMRMICLLCCCDTTDIGSAANLNTLEEKEIEAYQRQLKREMDRRQTIKKKQEDPAIASDSAKPGVEVVPGQGQIASQGSKQTMV